MLPVRGPSGAGVLGPHGVAGGNGFAQHDLANKRRRHEVRAASRPAGRAGHTCCWEEGVDHLLPDPPLVRLRRARVRVGRCGSSANVVRRVCVCCIAFVAESDLVEEPLYLGRVLGSVAVNEDARVRGGEEGEADE